MSQMNGTLAYMFVEIDDLKNVHVLSNIYND